MATDTIIINSAEIVLKGGNRRMFERQLEKNIQIALNGRSGYELQQQQASLFLRFAEPIAGEAERGVADALGRVFGIAQMTLARSCPADISAISQVALEQLAEIASGSFKVDVRRSDKRFPLASPEAARQVGADILRAKPGLSVDLRQPEHVVRVIIASGQAYVGLNPGPGPNGLPVGVSGRLVALLSGGIDSPVAAWKLASRGCAVTFVHCHSYPFVGIESLEKVKRLAAVLARWQPETSLYLLPFAEIQKQIVSKGNEQNRVLLYRRAMLRLAERVAYRVKALGLVTGDSVGQVASQTLENMRAVSGAVSLPIYRPLCGDDKETIVRQARRLGSYELSIEPHDDCCSLFVPDHPATRAAAAELEQDEAACALDDLLDSAIAQAEILAIEAGSTTNGRLPT